MGADDLGDTTARIFASHFYRRLQSACAMSASEPVSQPEWRSEHGTVAGCPQLQAFWEPEAR